MQVIFTSYFLLYSIVHIISSLTKHLEIMLTAALRKNLGPLNIKTEQWFMSSERPRAVVNMHFFAYCQTDVVNKQLLSPLLWNNPLSKTKFHSLIPSKETRFLWDNCL